MAQKSEPAQSFKANNSSQALIMKWKTALQAELAHQSGIKSLPVGDLLKLLPSQKVTSLNHDTVISINWPHYCSCATSACGGEGGYCYTLQGVMKSAAHAKKAAIIDIIATTEPSFFAQRVYEEVVNSMVSGAQSTLNVRYSGSGELTLKHIPAVERIRETGVIPWGFTRRIDVAKSLMGSGISVLLSADWTTDGDIIREAQKASIPMSYTSRGVNDIPPVGTFVTFPVHRSGRVSEVVDHPTLCPKVIDEFLNMRRQESWCQLRCNRCHATGN